MNILLFPEHPKNNFCTTISVGVVVNRDAVSMTLYKDTQRTGHEIHHLFSTVDQALKTRKSLDQGQLYMMMANLLGPAFQEVYPDIAPETVEDIPGCFEAEPSPHPLSIQRLEIAHRKCKEYIEEGLTIREAIHMAAYNSPYPAALGNSLRPLTVQIYLEDIWANELMQADEE